MLKTLSVWSDGKAQINTGLYIIECVAEPFTPELQDKLDEIRSAIISAGVSHLHVEKDTFRQFEHSVKAGQVTQYDFGSTVSSGDFDWIMQHVDVERAAMEAAESEAMGALLAAGLAAHNGA